ncbi:MAG: hypothetical protein ACJ0GT_02880 [Candidatus Actinomarina sp.]|tara:strand:- start:1643 stop:2683 length:1041 start_codon:yes stop_codon:yes gene_type:complete
MSDDIFSQLFNLFNSDDENVNWKLAEQISNHINKESQTDYLLSNQDLNYQEIFRVIQLSDEHKGELKDAPKEIAILDSREYGIWFLNSINHFDFSDLQMIDGNALGMAANQSSLIGMQLGNIAGFLSKNTWGLSHFGIILPKNDKLAINKKNFDLRIEQFEIDSKEATMALMLLEFVSLSLGEYSAPFSYVVSQMKKSNEELLKQIKDIEPNFDSSNFSNPEELMQNIPQLNNFDMESMLDVIFAPLSFYRSIIKYLAKNILDILDPSVIDLVMDLGLVSNQGPTSDFEIKISKYDEASDSFIEFLNKSSNQLSLHEIIADINLIPTVDELNDPISWAARTSLPPI